MGMIKGDTRSLVGIGLGFSIGFFRGVLWG